MGTWPSSVKAAPRDRWTLNSRSHRVPVLTPALYKPAQARPARSRVPQHSFLPSTASMQACAAARPCAAVSRPAASAARRNARPAAGVRARRGVAVRSAEDDKAAQLKAALEQVQSNPEVRFARDE